jgi:poly [ADP-ribose] polymerase
MLPALSFFLKIDTDKMPLGKISPKNILEAYQVLSDLQLVIFKSIILHNFFLNLQAMDGEEELTRALLVDFSNRFYTRIPQNFGLKAPPLISTKEMIKAHFNFSTKFKTILM